jgi:hypothetical protein
MKAHNLLVTGSLTAGNGEAISSISSSVATTTLGLGSRLTTIEGKSLVSGSSQVDVMSTTNISQLATTGSNTFQGLQTINGSLVVTGSLTAQQFIVSSSVTYLTESFASGSHKFGDSSDDTHQFTGSVYISGSVYITSSLNIGTGYGNSQLYVGGLSAQTSSALLDSGTRNGLVSILPLGGTAGNGGGIVLGSNTQGDATGYGQIALKAILINGAGQGTSDLVVSTRNATSDTALTERLRLTSGGNLGLGAIPTTSWGSSAKVLQVGSKGVIYNDGSNNLLFANNSYYDGSNNIYMSNGYATRYYQEISGGQHYFQVAPSGTTGTAITYLTAITIDNSARVKFQNTVFHYADLHFDTNASIRTISNYGYGGAVQLLRSDSTSTRWSRIGMVDATATNWLGGMTINNDTSATFDKYAMINNGGTYTDGTPQLNIKSASWAIVDATTYRQFQRRIAYVGDYEQHVILLHPIYNGTLIEFNKVSGTIYSTRGWTYAGYINETYELDTGTGYSSYSGTLSSKGALGRLYTCTYNSVKYLALMPEYKTSATSYHFDGYVTPSTAGESLKLVSYRNSNTGTILNSEINNSLALYTETSEFVSGLFRPNQGIRFANGATTLNYYEEGTFTPSAVGTPSFSSVTVVHGKYVRIGNQVTINCKWTVTPGGTGNKYLVFNLPFAFAITSSNGFTGAVSNYNEAPSAYSSNVGTTVRNTSSSDTQQYVEAVYINANAGSSLQLMMTYFTF